METNTANQDDELETHREMWNNFVRLIMFAAIGVIGILAWMALFLT